MWFKTRVGIYSVLEPLEIRVAKYPKAKVPSLSVFVRSLSDPSFDYKGIFGKFNAHGRTIHLAQFLMSDSSGAKIAECMREIEQAIATETKPPRPAA